MFQNGLFFWALFFLPPALAVDGVDQISSIIGDSSLSVDAQIGRLKMLTEDSDSDELAAVSQVVLLSRLVSEKRYKDVVSQSKVRSNLMSEYYWYYFAKAHYHLDHLKRAEKLLKKIKDSKTNRWLKYDARKLLVEIYRKKDNWRQARVQLRYLERKLRGTQSYPGILFQLIEVEKKNKNSWRACRWARKIYRSYPNDPTIRHWGVELKKVTLFDRPLGCFATLDQKKRRVKRWLQLGQEKRAREEIDVVIAGLPDEYGKALVEAEFLINSGYSIEASEKLLQYRETHSHQIDYLLLLARAGSKSANVNLASFAYLKANQLNPRGRKGRSALFKAAVINYQYQNYDLSLELFKKYSSKHGGSSRVRDSEWYIGWIHYLRGDYQDAIDKFDSILAKIRRRWRGWRRLPIDKYQYWKAVSLLKLDKKSEAQELFQEIGDQNLMTFYYLAAADRLKTMGVEMALRESEDYVEDYPARIPAADMGQKNSEQTSESTLVSDLSETPVDAEEQTDEQAEEEQPKISEFRSVRFRRHLKVATALSGIDWSHMSKWELYEVERNTRKREYQRSLIHYYRKHGFYNRAAYLSQVYFGIDRSRYGISGVRHLWEAAYPKAFESHVEKVSGDYRIPNDLIWAIMRAESIYKEDAVSPVGALGLMQVMPYTGRRVAKLLGDQEFDPQSLLRPAGAIKIGGRYLSRLSRLFAGKTVAVAGAYNAGPHRMKNWLSTFGHLEADEFIEHIPFLETRGYVKRVVRNQIVYGRLYKTSGADTQASLSQPMAVSWRGEVPLREDWGDL